MQKNGYDEIAVVAECEVTFTRFKYIKVNNRTKQRLLCIGISVLGHLNMVLLGSSDVGGGGGGCVWQA